MGGGDILVVTAAVVLGAIAAKRVSVSWLRSRQSKKTIVPLREGLIASNMPPFASLTAVARLGMALAWRATTWTRHLGYLGFWEGMIKSVPQ